MKRNLFFGIAAMLLAACNPQRDEYGWYMLQNNLEDTIVFVHENFDTYHSIICPTEHPIEHSIIYYDTIPPMQRLNIAYMEASTYDKKHKLLNYKDKSPSNYSLLIEGETYIINPLDKTNFLWRDNYTTIEPKLGHIFYIDEAYVEQLKANQAE